MTILSNCDIASRLAEVADLLEGFFDLVELEGLNNGLDFFHAPLSSSGAVRKAEAPDRRSGSTGYAKSLALN